MVIVAQAFVDAVRATFYGGTMASCRQCLRSWRPSSWRTEVCCWTASIATAASSFSSRMSWAVIPQGGDCTGASEGGDEVCVTSGWSRRHRPHRQMHDHHRRIDADRRSPLTDRPCFFVTAGRRGGKTTTLTMLIMAVTDCGRRRRRGQPTRRNGARRS